MESTSDNFCRVILESQALPTSRIISSDFIRQDIVDV